MVKCKKKKPSVPLVMVMKQRNKALGANPKRQSNVSGEQRGSKYSKLVRLNLPKF
jgi:hypothetical protein